jgi:hypothetical protein
MLMTAKGVRTCITRLPRIGHQVVLVELARLVVRSLKDGCAAHGRL